jgi:hypothetical protein
MQPKAILLRQNFIIRKKWVLHKGCPQNGYGTPPGRDGGAEHPSAGRSMRDRVSPHLAVELRHHQSRVQEDGGGPG